MFFFKKGKILFSRTQLRKVTYIITVTFMMEMQCAVSKSFSKTYIFPAYRMKKFTRTAVKFVQNNTGTSTMNFLATLFV